MSFIEYTGSTVRQCLEATTEIYQDGYIHCPVIDEWGCAECMRRFGDGSNWKHDKTQNYERKPRWRKEGGENMKNCGLPEGYEDKCCLNEGGICTLDNADYQDIDRAVEQNNCGFIRVNDRYLLWKYGVPYKEYRCGNCEHFVRNEHVKGETFGECIHPHVECRPATISNLYYKIRTKEMILVQSKGFYIMAHACKYFEERGSERMPKRQFWTKCGRTFWKNSTAVVTGYTIDFEDPQNEECTSCPFKVEVTEGWPPVFKRWECRAGSEPPNHTTEWKGSLEDKNSIHFYSLDSDLLEDIRKYCEDHPDLGAGYNADHLADCRRTLAVHCSPNKKGMAAKKELVEKFFPNCPEECACNDWKQQTPEQKEESGVEKMNEVQVTRKKKAYKLHVEIMAAGEVAAEAFTSFCRMLKQMRDEKLYEELDYESFEEYCETAVGLKKSQAYNYIKAIEDFGEEKFQSIGKLGIRKLQLIGTIPEESREQFMAETDVEAMTTRQVEAAIKEWKKKFKESEDRLKGLKEFADKQAKYADEHMMRAREAEKKISDMEIAMQALDTDKRAKEMEIRELSQQLEQARRNADPAKLRELSEIVFEKQSEIEDYQKEIGILNTRIGELQKQLREKPIETTAVIQESGPDTAVLKTHAKVSATLESLIYISTDEARAWAEVVKNGDNLDTHIWISNLENAIGMLSDMLSDLRSDG
jgi:uncharacterized coiled-coil protein SlyX